MPTRRMIDPTFWQSESMADLSEGERLFFIGLISNADDQGRIRGHPALLRSLIYPFNDISTDEIERRIEALSSIDCIFVYDAQGKRAIQIINWWQYQSPQWAYPSKLSPPDGWQDRLRYRADNKVCQDNWDGTGGFRQEHKNDGYTNLGKGLPSSLPKDLPKAKGGSIEIELESDIDNDDKEKAAEIFKLFQENITISISPLIADEMKSAEYLKLPISWWQEAIKIAVDNNARKWAYVRSVLDRSIKAGQSPCGLGPPKKGQHSNGRSQQGKNKRTNQAGPGQSTQTTDEWIRNEIKRLDHKAATGAT